VAFDRSVLAGGEGLAEGKQVLHDLQDEVHMLVGVGHEERRRNKVDGEEWRRPWQRVRVPDEGPANMEGWSTHEHRGVMGMLFRYLIRLEVGRRGLSTWRWLGFSPAAMAAWCSGGWGVGGRWRSS
jgi:hypothetical protein